VTQTTQAVHVELPVHRCTLTNGLRVVVAPDRRAPAVGVCVVYDVGFRSEPEGRTGFAHLFEHLMFQGSENVGKMEHARLIEGAGGVMNGSTHPDYTNYFEVLPTGALDLALFLEADRMRAPRLTQENLENQIAVVCEEIRVNVLNQPYGGFPWIPLPQVAFDSFANSHDGYGAFAELESVTLADARDFFNRYYAPGNAVLVIAGDVEPEDAFERAERFFGSINKGRVPKRPSFAEPVPTTQRRHQVLDLLAPQPALALGWRVPDPVTELDDYLAHLVLAELLAEGEAARLQRRLVLDAPLATSLSLYLGAFGDPFDGRDPVLLTLEATHPSSTTADRLIEEVGAELTALASEPPGERELAGVQARLAAQLLRGSDSLVGRVTSLAAIETIHGRAELVAELPGLCARVTADQVSRAAAQVAAQPPSVLEVRPGATA
jgi:predicted Zn-dependent peptidase